MFKCNCYVNQFERVNEKYCNGWMHAVLNKKPHNDVLGKTKTNQSKKQTKQKTNKLFFEKLQVTYISLYLYNNFFQDFT